MITITDHQAYAYLTVNATLLNARMEHKWQSLRQICFTTAHDSLSSDYRSAFCRKFKHMMIHGHVHLLIIQSWLNQDWEQKRIWIDNENFQMKINGNYDKCQYLMQIQLK